MNVFYLILLLLAAICFGIAAFFHYRGREASRLDFVALGLLLWVLVPLIQHIKQV